MRFFDGPFEESQIPIQIWTDGACSGNPGSGGAAAIIRYSNSTVKEITFYEEQSTNQRMEIKAVIIAIAEILKTSHDEKNIAKVGDTVRLLSTRPLSKTKRYELVEILTKSQEA